MPGGVSSPVRSFSSVGSDPFFAASGAGALLRDVDGNDYIDLVQSWGALLFGHSDPDVVAAVQAAAARGTSFGTPTDLEVELARLVASLVPNAERVRFVSSGTEAGMTAVRLARAVTGRTKILKFAGCYHGHSDALLADAGSGVATLGIPGTPGIPAAVTGDTIVIGYNDAAGFDAALERFGADLAAVLVEPVAANMGLVLPQPGFLAALRDGASNVGALLVFDEVITGFRVAHGGAQEHYGVAADLVMLGKILGGGLPAAAVAGRAGILDELAPAGRVYQAGTLSGNPVAMAAGVATLSKIVADPLLHARLQETARALARALIDAAEKAGVPVSAAALGGLAGFFFSDAEVANYDEARSTDGDLYARFFRGMLRRGVYLPPSRFEALFVSAAHTTEHIDLVHAAATEVLAGA